LTKALAYEKTFGDNTKMIVRVATVIPTIIVFLFTYYIYIL
jgi:hypothetical protein